MAIKVKPVGASATKLVERAQAASAEYATNAAAAGGDWEAATRAAQGAFTQAVTASGIGARFARGVQKAGAAKYTRKVTAVGAGRFSQGVAAGQEDYVSGVEPYFSTIAALTLPQRQPRGSAANYARVQAVGNALHAKRLAMLGVGAG